MPKWVNFWPEDFGADNDLGAFPVFPATKWFCIWYNAMPDDGAGIRVVLYAYRFCNYFVTAHN